ncbi:MAG: hypothetical protein KF901_29435 [Myxococcales bacterium]|nr:hypothetical protein [Myxococcales bacterium]
MRHSYLLGLGFGVAWLTSCSVNPAGLAGGDGSVVRPDGGFSCPEGTVDLDGDPSNGCECIISEIDYCDGIDNDCDPSTPDGWNDPSLGGMCDGDDADFCEYGTWVCRDGAPYCNDPGEEVEQCDGMDNNCDGVIDEGCMCTGDDVRNCGTDVGECVRGVQRCEGGTWSAACDGGRGPQPEVCNGLDDDCNGRVDEGLPAGCWIDNDRDGYAPAGAMSRCRPAEGCGTGWTDRAPTSGNVDCNDNNAAINPAATEICNGIDDNCDGRTDEDNPGGGARCGTTDRGACRFGAITCTMGMLRCVGAIEPMTEVCNGEDTDCNGTIDNGLPNGCWRDMDGDGFAPVGAMARCRPASGCPTGFTMREPTPGNSDCDDSNAAVYPGAPEVCNGIDNNCSGTPDSGLPPGCWRDMDGDTWAPQGAMSRCRPASGCPTGFTMREPTAGNRDCNDNNAAVNPGATEVCNGIDDNCSGTIDDVAGVGTACGTNVGECTAGTRMCVGTALACVGEVGPTAEVCDGRDNNCDGMIDDGDACGSSCTSHREGGRLYVFCNRTAAASAGQTHCASLGASFGLASINADAEQTLLWNRAVAISDNSWWIGLSRPNPSGTWSWADGTAAPQSDTDSGVNHWGTGQPSGGGNHCARMNNSDGGKWHSLACTEARRFICEGPAP